MLLPVEKMWSRLQKIAAGVQAAMCGALVRVAIMVVLFPLLIILLPLLALGLLWRECRASGLRSAFLAKWSPQGKVGLIVYSNSPNWKDYIEATWLPRVADKTVVLNWSDRQHWSREYPLEAKLFRAYAGTKEFNPIAIIFTGPPVRPIAERWAALCSGAILDAVLFSHYPEREVIRFRQPFKDFKHGRDRALRQAEERMFAAIDAGKPQGEREDVCS